MIKAKNMSGDPIIVNYFRNSSKYEVAKLDKELKDGTYASIRVMLVPFSYEDNEKICDMNNETDFDDIDVYIWDGNVFHDTAIHDIKNLGYKTKSGGSINMMYVFAGIKDEDGIFKIGPFSKSFDKTAIRDKLAKKACAIASKKTGNQFEVEYF